MIRCTESRLPLNTATYMLSWPTGIVDARLAMSSPFAKASDVVFISIPATKVASTRTGPDASIYREYAEEARSCRRLCASLRRRCEGKEPRLVPTCHPLVFSLIHHITRRSSALKTLDGFYSSLVALLIVRVVRKGPIHRATRARRVRLWTLHHMSLGSLTDFIVLLVACFSWAAIPLLSS